MSPFTTSSSVSHSLPSVPLASKLSEQLSQRRDLNDSGTTYNNVTGKNSLLGPPLRPSPKSRSLSDASKPTSRSTSKSDDSRPSSKDDISLSSVPETPRRPSLNQELQLHLPAKPTTPSSVSSQAPLSPKLDSSQIYGSPGSVLPRRSRGLDFSRACTNLHHSTLAESSPDSSPIIGGRGVQIPQRRGSIGSTSVHPFSTSGPADRATVSSSVSSVNMIESDTSSSEDEEDEAMMGDRDDMMITNTPQANKMSHGMSPFAPGGVSSPGNDWMGGYSQAATSLMSFQRARIRSKGARSRHSSSSASGNSSKPSPGPLSPPVMKSIENPGNGYFGSRTGAAATRRESLSFGARELRLSDFSDEGEGRAGRGHSPTTSNSEGGYLGVIRRAVTRRGSLLPKTKTFARIRAALMEESAPVDSDSKREAEVIRQVRESEPGIPQTSPEMTAHDYVSPGGSVAHPVDLPGKAPSHDEPNFSEQAHRNSAGADFWNNFDERYRTPPPSFRQAAASSVSEDELAMDFTPSARAGSSAGEFAKPGERPYSRGSTPLQSHSAAVAEIKRKRRREDDFDPNLFKRRAVSPSMSAQSSPIMPNSPAVKDYSSNIWGPPPKSNLGSLFADHPQPDHGSRNAPTTPHTGTLKRVGLQGMTETNDGLMNMSI
ncbi:hypothetical protein P168DRAFT_291366, partial [Aspergillus campestris IBT 28561]